MRITEMLITMDRIHLFHELLLRVPLQLVWRLVGLNHRLHRLMFDDFLWKRRCQLEFPLLPTIITSYRTYWLKRTTRAYGRLWFNEQLFRLEGQEVPEIRRPKQLFDCGNIVVWNDYGELYWIYPYHQERQIRLMLRGIERVISITTSVQSILLAQGTNNNYLVYNKDGSDELTTTECYFIPRSYHVKRMMWFNLMPLYLLEEGQLVLAKDEYTRVLLPSKEDPRKVLDMKFRCLMGYYQLEFELLFEDGTEEARTINLNKPLEEVKLKRPLSTQQRIALLTSSEKGPYEEPKVTDTVKYSSELIPISLAGTKRDEFVPDRHNNGENIIVEVDGNAHRELKYLRGGRAKMRYQGLIDAQVDSMYNLFIAQSRDRKQ